MADKAFQIHRAEEPITGVTDALTPDEVAAQTVLIQDVMRRVMQEGEHFGRIAGFSSKPTLFKAGAEKLCLTFRMAPDPLVDIMELERGHREYRVKCDMYSIPSGKKLGSGVGSASTMETKWRYRSGGGADFTGRPVPREYWDVRKSDPAHAQEMLGGRGFSARKNDAGQWEIAKAGERTEHENPADNYNTCLKMAKKRALVDAVLTVTAASDIFTQDIEDLTGEEVSGTATVAAAPAAQQPVAPKEGAPAPERQETRRPAAREEGEEGGQKVSNAQGRMLYARFRSKGIHSLEVMDRYAQEWFGTRLFELPKNRVDDARRRIEELPEMTESQIPSEEEGF